ncbi:hypothetical protein PX52LOC_07910 [Limnoglobus roseus]|uniref:IS5/IS1182 family transposase n=1 Tax=Limnoglobus roseus TaxID=2598579 RepID=A0A5C1AT72_9BACT|nr:hypothetical protein PX52LOC_07910 [Limnoglobus roseus]
MPRRHELTDAQWALVEPLLPPPSRGRRWADHRAVVGGGPVRGRHRRPVAGPAGAGRAMAGGVRAVPAAGRRHVGRHPAGVAGRAGEFGLIDGSRFGVDATIARASRSAAGAKRGADSRAGRPRLGPGSRRARDEGEPGGVRQRPAGRRRPHPGGRRRDGRAGRRPRLGVRPPAGDKGYDHPPVRRRPHPRHRLNRGRPFGFDRAAYRPPAERGRAVYQVAEGEPPPATRYEKSAVSDLAVAHVAMIRQYLKRVTETLSDRT